MQPSSIGPGATLGRYQVKQVLRADAREQALLCMDPLLGRQVVALVPRMEYLRGLGDDGVTRYRHRLRHVASLRHPNLVELHDAGEQDGAPYHVVAWADGRSLHDLIMIDLVLPGEGISLAITLRVLANLAAVLQYLHDRGVSYQHVEAERLVVRDSGEPVLIGLSCDAVLGADPEAASARRDVRAKDGDDLLAPDDPSVVDIRGIGETLFFAISGVPAVPAPPESDQTVDGDAPDMPDLSLLDGLAPTFVVEVIRRCFRAGLRHGYKSAAEVKRALDTALDHMERERSGVGGQAAQPRDGQALLLRVEYDEANLPGEYREYRIENFLSEGTFGDVFRAREAASDRMVALKILKHRWISDENAVTRFRREALVMSRLSHENIVRVHNFGRYAASFFIAMELLSGPTLEDVLEAESPMTVKRALHLLRPVLAGLAAIHSEDILHRDLKPGNVKVMFDESGEEGADDPVDSLWLPHREPVDAYGDEEEYVALPVRRVVLFDFGISQASDLHKLTETGLFIGTLNYASPEQVMARPLTTSADIYAVGVIFYEMLSGRLPHEAESQMALMRSIVLHRPEPITEFRADLRDEEILFLEDLLARDASQRPTANEAVERVDELLRSM
jgi:serine/threonine protein kinase